jgi:amino acid transporter
MWPGIIFALILAFLTALSYAELARKYPEAGTGSSYYFAEKAFVDKSEVRHHKWARLAKLVTGWAAHLFYWVYPGVMVAFMAILVSYLGGLFGIDIGVVPQMVICVIFAILVGYIAYRGVNGSTFTALLINIIQLVALVVFSVLAIAYRVINPDNATFVHSAGASVVLPHDIMNVLFQSTVAILILVGFESTTAFAAEAKNPKRDIPRAALLALVIQGLLAYLFEYFAANFAISDKLINTAEDGTITTGLDAAALSTAPIGDMIRLVGDSLLGGIGFGLTIVIALTVALAILGTTLSAMNTGVRITYAMAQDAEMPEPLGLLHGSYATPHTAVWAMVVVSALVGILGVVSVVTLTGITLASNFGTFVLYALTCLWTIIAFHGQAEGSVLKHIIVPVLGLLANLAMLITILGMGILGGGTSQQESLLALGIAAFWAIISAGYVFFSSRRSGRAMFATPSSSSPVVAERV